MRDLVLVLAAGGDTLRHLATLGGGDQRVLFGAVASPAAANRTIVALGEDELVVERLAAARKAARARAWAAGGAPPVVAAALAGEVPAEPLCVDLDATLVTAHLRRQGRRGGDLQGWRSSRGSSPRSHGSATSWR